MIVDLRDQLERADWSIGTSPKSSATVHWPAATEPINDPLAALHGYAAYHVSKDWSPEPGVQGGDGIQYARAADQRGTVYILRDLDAVLWHCDNAFGNATSVPYLALVAVDEEPSPALRAALRAQIEWDGFLRDTYPHGPTWTQTECPGPPLRLWVERGMPANEEEEMTKEEQKALVREVLVEDGYPQTILAMKAAYDPLVAEARAAGVIDDAQERKLSELDARLDAIGRASAPTP